MANVLVPVADGVEEIEFITIVDTLRRGGTEVTLASCQPGGRREIIGAHGIVSIADKIIDDCIDEEYDIIVVPGGMVGVEYLTKCSVLIEMLKNQKKIGKWYAAICAAPAVVLSPHGLLDQVQATCYPSLVNKLETAIVNAQREVVSDISNKVVTAQGPGNALAFSLTLIDILYGKESYRSVAKEMVASWVL